MQSDITVLYRGPDVDSHTISLDDFLPSMHGFYSSLKLIKDYYGYEDYIELRLEKIDEGSVLVKLKGVWKDADPNTRLITAGTVTVALISVLGSQLTNVINLKKHLQGLPPNKIEYVGENINVYNINDSQVSVSPDTFELSQDVKLSKSLNKYVRPLHENKIEETVFEINDGTNQHEQISISASEKHSFVEIENDVSSTRSAKLRGKFVTLNKQKNTGSFQPEAGKSFRYKLASDSPESMYYDFAYNGIVEIYGIAKFNSDEEMVSIEISEIQKLQKELFEEINED